MSAILSPGFYRRKDVVNIARELLGKVICTKIHGHYTTAMITETEAYCGATDRACHAWNGRRTPRTEIMYAVGGAAYVYLCYGIHHLFNVVTNEKNRADAVLVRAAEPLEGAEFMQQRRNRSKISRELTAGPGNLSKALGIDVGYTGHRLWESPLWIEDRGIFPDKRQIAAGKRIGVDYAGEDSLLPWRFYLRDNPFVSKK